MTEPSRAWVRGPSAATDYPHPDIDFANSLTTPRGPASHYPQHYPPPQFQHQSDAFAPNFAATYGGGHYGQPFFNSDTSMMPAAHSYQMFSPLFPRPTLYPPFFGPHLPVPVRYSSTYTGTLYQLDYPRDGASATSALGAIGQMGPTPMQVTDPRPLEPAPFSSATLYNPEHFVASAPSQFAVAAHLSAAPVGGAVTSHSSGPIALPLSAPQSQQMYFPPTSYYQSQHPPTSLSAAAALPALHARILPALSAVAPHSADHRPNGATAPQSAAPVLASERAPSAPVAAVTPTATDPVLASTPAAAFAASALAAQTAAEDPASHATLPQSTLPNSSGLSGLAAKTQTWFERHKEQMFASRSELVACVKKFADKNMFFISSTFRDRSSHGEIKCSRAGDPRYSDPHLEDRKRKRVSLKCGCKW